MTDYGKWARFDDEGDDAGDAAPARAVEIIADGMERDDVGGAVVEATLPPCAAAFEVLDDAPSTANVHVLRSFILPAGGLVELQVAYTVDVEVVPEAPPNAETASADSSACGGHAAR